MLVLSVYREHLDLAFFSVDPLELSPYYGSYLCNYISVEVTFVALCVCPCSPSLFFFLSGCFPKGCLVPINLNSYLPLSRW